METPIGMVGRMPEITLDASSGDAKSKLFHSRTRKKPSPTSHGKSSLYQVCAGTSRIQPTPGTWYIEGVRNMEQTRPFSSAGK